MSKHKFKLGDPVRVTLPGYWFNLVGTVDDIAPQEFSVGVTFPDKAPCNFRESELILAEATTVKDMAEQEIDGDRVRGASAPNRRAQVLRTAESLVNGQRADDYGPPQENFGRVAAMWSAQFAAKLKEPLTADEVAIALVHLKLSRLANTPDHADSFIDAAGYIALAAEIAEASK